MKTRLVIALIAATLLAPTISQAADIPDEQYKSLEMPGANTLGYQANESNFAKTESSSWFNFTTSDGTPSGKLTQVSICNTGKEPGCEFTVHAMFRAVPLGIDRPQNPVSGFRGR